MDRMRMQAPSLADERYAALASLFPGAVTEAVGEDGMVIRAIDKDVLEREINTHVVEGREERYQFTWPDKRRAALLANTPVSATLRPCREESVGFDGTRNLYIEGDNLDVLKLLRETYLGRVRMVYIDPPYNTGGDFVYEDDFSEGAAGFLTRDGQYDEYGDRMVTNLVSNGRFHTDWLNMMYPRLRVARDLLADDGVIFISIDDGEVANLIKMCNEVYGESNFLAYIAWEKRYTRSNNARFFYSLKDSILVYRKSPALQEIKEPRTSEADAGYTNPDNDLRGDWMSSSYVNPATRSQRPNLTYAIQGPAGRIVEHPTHAWKYSLEEHRRHVDEDRLWWGVNNDAIYPRLKLFLSEASEMVPVDLWSYRETGSTDSAGNMIKGLFNALVFDTPKPHELIVKMLRLTSSTTDDDIILDFFSGSATTAHAVMQLNAEDGGARRFIMVQLPEACKEGSEAAKAGFSTICDIGKERIRRAGARIIAERPDAATGLDVGFRVLKLDSSNMRDVHYTPQDYVRQLDLDGLVDNVKPDRTAEDLLFQAMLDLGVEPSSAIEARLVGGKTVYHVGEGRLAACFEAVTDDVVTEMARARPDFAVFRDGGFASDSALVNLEQAFKAYSPSTRRLVL